MRRLALAAAALLLSGCAAMERGGEDVAVVATYPVHLLTTPAREMRDRWSENPGKAVATAPLLVPWYMLGDTFFTVVSAGDAALTPFYAPFRVERLRIYRLDRFPPTIDPWNAREVAEDVLETTAVIAYYVLEALAEGYGNCNCRSSSGSCPSFRR